MSYSWLKYLHLYFLELNSIHVLINSSIVEWKPIPVAVRSKAWVCGSSLAGNAGSNPVDGIDACLLWVFCVCFQVEVSATGRLLVQRSPTECGASECDL